MLESVQYDMARDLLYLFATRLRNDAKRGMQYLLRDEPQVDFWTFVNTFALHVEIVEGMLGHPFHWFVWSSIT
jgi:hypothetical protein